jgi:hypothetical protein
MRDDRVRRAAAEDILLDIIQWAGADWREEDREEVINDLMAVDHNFDGYDAEDATYAVYTEQTEAWLKANPGQKPSGYAVPFEDAKAS